jgi:hypothetical protein
MIYYFYCKIIEVTEGLHVSTILIRHDQAFICAEEALYVHAA